jgi:molybdate transport system substrate-binding protein
MFKKILLSVVLCFSLASHGFAATLSVVAASDLTFCLLELAKAFQAEKPKSEIKPMFGASGNLFAQIKNGAPYDVFMSADMYYPEELAKVGAADRATLFAFARGHLMLWTANPNISLDKGLQALKQPSIKHIALANPETAPYGRAARAALQQSGLWEELKPLLVYGDNISQTMQYAETGNADVAIISRSLVLSPKMAGKGVAQALPETLYPAISQGYIVTNRGKTNPLAAKFAQFLQSDKAKAILKQYGFSIPEKKSL